MTDKLEEIEDNLISPLLTVSKTYVFFVFSLLIVVGYGAYAWVYQVINGLGVTGLSHRIFYGIYISNFIFFIGISYSGTLISAVLRLTGAEWRNPLTRMAEVITVIGISVGLTMILVDMGRPERVFYVPYASRLQSPLFWDMLSISTYLVGSLIFFYLPLIPDLALLRDHFADKQGFRIRKLIYKYLAVGWRGSDYQKKILDRSIGYMSVILIPIAVMAHTVIALIFAVTSRVGWHSTIFGPYFVVAAIFSGTAAIVMVMTLFRKIYHLEEYITFRHFRNMAYILLVLLATYFYFTITEYFTTSFRGANHDMEILESLFFGTFAYYFWFFMIFGMIIPALMLMYGSWKYENERSIWMIFTAAVLIVIGMWIKRYIIIVPALARPYVLEEWTVYDPTWVEWAITAAGVAGFILAFAIFVKIFPVISIWELKEDFEHQELERISRILHTGRFSVEHDGPID